MTLLGMISSHEPLCHAVGEQLEQALPDLHVAFFATLDEACAAWSEGFPPLLFVDGREALAPSVIEAFSARLAVQRPEPIVLVLGALPDWLSQARIGDVFSAPMRMGFFLSRLQFYRRRLERMRGPIWHLGPWTFSAQERTLASLDGQREPVRLTDKEAALLDYLLAASAPVSREDVLADVWGYDPHMDTHTLETHVYRLRRKIMASAVERPDVFLVERGAYQIHPAWREGG